MSESQANWEPSSCVVFSTGGGVGNILSDLVNAVVHSSQSKQALCYVFWWHRARMRYLHGGLQDFIDFDSVSKFGPKIRPLDHQQADTLARFSIGEPVMSHRAKHMMVIEPGKMVCLNRHITHHTYPPTFVRKVWSSIEPEKSLSLLVESLATEYITPSTIGVHVRRTDNKLSSSKSTTDKFFVAIDKSLNESHDRIFLATDDEAVEQEFVQRYGHLVSFSMKSAPKRWTNLWGRRGLVTINTFREGFADILLLGKCDTILGSFGSSFSKVAAKTSKNGAKLKIIM